MRPYRIAALVIGLAMAAAVAALMGGVGSAADSQWALLGSQVPGSVDRPVWSIAASPAHPAVLLEATQGRGVLRSIDGGSTWASVITSGDAAWVVRFDPQQAGLAYAGTQTEGLWRSADVGKTWSRVLSAPDPDLRAIDMAPGLVLVGTAHGAFSSTDGGVTWQSLGLQNLDVSAVAIVASGTTNTLFAGADNGTSGGYLLTASGTTGSWAIVHGGFPGDATVAALAAGPAPAGSTGHSIFAGTSQGLYRSDDTGATWSQVAGLPQSDVNLVAVNPASGDQVYAASDGDQGQGGVFRSLDHGATWSPLATAGLPKRPRVTALALQAGSAMQVLAATWNPTSSEVGLYRVADPSAAVAGSPAALPSSTARATSRPTAQPRASSPTERGGSGLELGAAWRNVGIGAVLIALLCAVFVFRRWRMRREDLQTYRR